MRPVLLAAILAALLPALSGCAGAPARLPANDLSELAPRDSLLFAAADLAPSARERRALTALGEPSPRAIAARLAGRLGVRFGRDVAPWVGRRVAVFATAWDPAHAGVILSVRDPAQARAALPRLAAHHPGVVATLVRGRVVVGGRAAVEAVKAGRDRGLGETKAYRDAPRPPGGPGLATVFSAGTGPLALAGHTLVPDGPRTLGVVHARPGGLDLETLVPDDRGLLATAGLGTGGPGAAPAPAGALLAAGSRDLGRDLAPVIDTMLDAVGGRSGLGAYLEYKAGVELQPEVLDRLGAASWWVRRDPDGRLGGALVVRVRDPRGFRPVLGRLRAFLRGRGIDRFPVTLVGDRLVVAVGPRAPGPRLSSARRLAGRVDVQRALALVPSGPVAAAARGLLTPFSALAVTTAPRGDHRELVRFRLVRR